MFMREEERNQQQQQNTQKMPELFSLTVRLIDIVPLLHVA